MKSKKGALSGAFVNSGFEQLLREQEEVSVWRRVCWGSARDVAGIPQTITQAGAGELLCAAIRQQYIALALVHLLRSPGGRYAGGGDVCAHYKKRASRSASGKAISITTIVPGYRHCR